MVLDQVLVIEGRSSGKVDGREPQRIVAGVPGGTESDGRVGVPAAKLRDAARDVNGLTEVGGATLVEGHCGKSRGRAALTRSSGSCGTPRPSCVGGSGARTSCRATSAGGGDLGLGDMLVAILV